MPDTVAKDGKQPEGTSQEGTPEPTVRMSDYKTLQRELQKEKDKNKELEAKTREGESVEQALEREREERKALERDLKVSRVKGEAPRELHGLIDNFVTKYGVVPDEDDLELLKKAAPVRTEETPNTTTTESSGIRNASAGKPKGGELSDDDLKRIKLSDIA